MEIHETKNQERRRRDGGVNKQIAKENRDRDESPLDWTGTGTEEKHYSTDNENQKITPTTSPKRTKNLKIDRHETTPPMRQRSSARIPGTTQH